MKKSKVIIPAMALLLFSTAASITGTVAWFSSTRVFSATASSFKVGQIDGGLEASISGGVGTEALKSSASLTYYDKANVMTGYALTHGSFDTVASTAWILNRDSSGPTDYRVTKYSVSEAETAFATETNRQKAADKWFVKDDSAGTHYYVAFSWTITFKYLWGSETKDVGIYLNRQSSTLKFKAANAEGDPQPGTGTSDKTAYGFRIAFVSGSGEKKVWGNNSSDATTLYYADGQHETTNRKAYTTANYFTPMTSDYTVVTDAATDVDSTNKGRPERIGTLCSKDKQGSGSDAGKTLLSVKCVAWYEGEDLANVISSAEMDIVDVTMNFYARSDYGTTPA